MSTIEKNYIKEDYCKRLLKTKYPHLVYILLSSSKEHLIKNFLTLFYIKEIECILNNGLCGLIETNDFFYEDEENLNLLLEIIDSAEKEDLENIFNGIAAFNGEHFFQKYKINKNKKSVEHALYLTLIEEEMAPV